MNPIMSQTPATPIQSAKLDELRELFGDDAEVVSLFQDFFADIPDHLASLHAAIQSREPNVVRQHAHTLKGSSGGLGAERVQGAACILEESGRNDSLETADEQLERLELELERLHSWLAEHNLL